MLWLFRSPPPGPAGVRSPLLGGTRIVHATPGVGKVDRAIFSSPRRPERPERACPMVRQDPSTEPAPMRPIRTLAHLLLLCAPCLFATACASGEWVELQGHRYQVEIADTDAERARGLMFRDELPAGHEIGREHV